MSGNEIPRPSVHNLECNFGESRNHGPNVVSPAFKCFVDLMYGCHELNWSEVAYRDLPSTWWLFLASIALFVTVSISANRLLTDAIHIYEQGCRNRSVHKPDLQLVDRQSTLSWIEWHIKWLRSKEISRRKIDTLLVSSAVFIVVISIILVLLSIISFFLWIFHIHIPLSPWEMIRPTIRDHSSRLQHDKTEWRHI